MSTDTQNNAPMKVEQVNWPAVEARISEFVGEYEMVGEDEQGRDGRYTPNESERALILDAMHGALADAELMALLRPAAPVAAQPDLTQQTLDDVKAGIPARDAEIEALRKEIETLQAQQPVSGADGLQADGALVADERELVALAVKHHIRFPRNRDLIAFIDEARASLAAAQPATQPQPSGNTGELPELTIQWHDTPEAVHRIFWEKAALENGMTYEDLMEGVMVGETEHREKVDLTYEQEIQAIRDQKCWGCADTETNQIHAWAAPDVDRTLLIHMLTHEIGHLTGEPLPDDIQEELRAETFGKVAAMAYQMLQAQQDADKVDAEPDMYWDDDDPERCQDSIHNVLVEVQCNRDLSVGDVVEVQRAIRLPNASVRITAVENEDGSGDLEYEVIDAARKEPDQ
ncbi:hypothetical protein [Alcaligenes phenolicus]|uniref:hypothetical protein n=1 Tax=Alcaligenes phenolicus TaxID=232846 RepID=UPI002BE450F8|nr:hypothetical protein [Alcaligenes phenolicus]HRO20851.1 hypothetical protein [Alcaligenes phenolicus]HRP13682.1 hypothetical protein [Alcaligenes phenolicus]